MDTWKDKLVNLEACEEALKYCNQYTEFADAWNNCERHNWIIWLISKLGSDSKEKVEAFRQNVNNWIVEQTNTSLAEYRKKAQPFWDVYLQTIYSTNEPYQQIDGVAFQKFVQDTAEYEKQRYEANRATYRMLPVFIRKIYPAEVIEKSLSELK